MSLLPDTLHGRRWRHHDKPPSYRSHRGYRSPRERSQTPQSSENSSPRSQSGRKRPRSCDPSTSPRRASEINKASDPNPGHVCYTRADAVAQHLVGSDVKGKGRADSVQPLVKPNPASESSNLDYNQPVYVPKGRPIAQTIDTSTTRRLAPRKKSLLESVKAHLAMNGPTSSGSDSHGLRDHAPSNTPGDKPTLLSRLAYPRSPGLLTHSSTVKDGPNGDAPLKLSTITVEKPSSVQKEANLAYNKETHAPNQVGIPAQGQHSITANSNPHTKLLSREKMQADDLQGSFYSEYAESSLPTSISSSHIPVSSPADLAVREASLRTQAQLRARLAAVKRLTTASEKP